MLILCRSLCVSRISTFVETMWPPPVVDIVLLHISQQRSESQRGKCNCSLMKILIINKFLLSQKYFCNFSDECLCRVVDTCSVMHSLVGSQCMVSNYMGETSRYTNFSFSLPPHIYKYALQTYP